MTTYYGIDPDLHAMPIAAFWPDENYWEAHVFRVPAKFKGRDAVAEMLRVVLEKKPSSDPVPYWVDDMFAAFFDGSEVVALEAQELARTGVKQHKRPQDIVTLGQLAGGMLGLLLDRMSWDKVLFPLPSEWKGSKPKSVMQARLYEEQGWGYEVVGKASAAYCRPQRPPDSLKNIKPADWKHVGDAMLLAKWASHQRPQ